MSCARVLSSWVCAVMMSLRAETPTEYLFFVIASVRLYASTAFSSSLIWSSAALSAM